MVAGEAWSVSSPSLPFSAFCLLSLSRFGHCFSFWILISFLINLSRRFLLGVTWPNMGRHPEERLERQAGEDPDSNLSAPSKPGVFLPCFLPSLPFSSFPKKTVYNRSIFLKTKFTEKISCRIHQIELAIAIFIKKTKFTNFVSTESDQSSNNNNNQAILYKFEAIPNKFQAISTNFNKSYAKDPSNLPNLSHGVRLTFMRVCVGPHSCERFGRLFGSIAFSFQ